jgi:hypothetical protein
MIQISRSETGNKVSGVYGPSAGKGRLGTPAADRAAFGWRARRVTFPNHRAADALQRNR